MKVAYDEIIAAMGEPQWWNEDGVPRFVVFHPSLATVYGDEAVLMEITCQACRRCFTVCVCNAPRRAGVSILVGGPIHYGDPPNVWCCAAGNTMNSEHVRVIERWRRDDNGEWAKIEPETQA